MTIALRMVIRDEVLGADMRVANKEIHKDPNTTPAASDDIPLAWRRAIVIWKVVEESSKIQLVKYGTRFRFERFGLFALGCI